MKFWRNLFLLVLLCPVLVYLALPLLPWNNADLLAAADEKKTVSAAPADEEMRGVWVSSVLNLDYPNQPTTDKKELQRQADEILDKAAELGFNTVFLQVRPCADSLCQSDYYPWSIYLTGQQGTPPEDNFDPLDYWVEGAHKRGMELHAWINPYRVTRAAAEWDKLAEDSPAKQHPEWVVKYNNNYYFDPALPEVRELVENGVVELIDNYQVDGIHLDDYFYPGVDFDDADSFAEYGDGFADIADWRRDNVNQLVKKLHRTIKNYAPDVDFGISPAGIWASKTLHPEGSDTTSTYSSYFNMYADTKHWVEEGWLDYIAPQIYWEAGHKTADFTALLDWWCGVVRGTDVKLYIGLADYKTLEAKAADSPWFDGQEIKRQLAACAAADEVDGAIHFRFGSIESSLALQRVIAAAYADNNAAVMPDEPVNKPLTDRNEQNNRPAVPGAVTVWVDDEQLQFDQQPFVQNGRVMLPMRTIFEALGATVDYKAGKITAEKADVLVRLTLGSDKMQVNDDIKRLDVPAQALNGRTLLPLRAVSEALGCKVDWDNATKTVTITTITTAE